MKPLYTVTNTGTANRSAKRFYMIVSPVSGKGCDSMQDFEYNGVYYGTFTDFKRCANKSKTAAKRQVRTALKWYRNDPTEENKRLVMVAMGRLADAFVLIRHYKFIEMEKEKREMPKPYIII